MKKTRLSLFYLGSYLTIIGLGLLLAPHDTLKLLLSNGDYGDVIPRVAVFYRLHCRVLCDDLRPLLLGSDSHCRDRVCANPQRLPSRSTEHMTALDQV